MTRRKAKPIEIIEHSFATAETSHSSAHPTAAEVMRSLRKKLRADIEKLQADSEKLAAATLAAVGGYYYAADPAAFAGKTIDGECVEIKEAP